MNTSALSRRESIAAAALQGMLANRRIDFQNDGADTELAAEAVRYADALLAELDRTDALQRAEAAEAKEARGLKENRELWNANASLHEEIADKDEKLQAAEREAEVMRAELAVTKEERDDVVNAVSEFLQRTRMGEVGKGMFVQNEELHQLAYILAYSPLQATDPDAEEDTLPADQEPKETLREVDKPHADTLRLDWLLRLIDHKGTDGIAALPWTVKKHDGEDSRIKFDRAAIDAAMSPTPDAAANMEGQVG